MVPGGACRCGQVRRRLRLARRRAGVVCSAGNIEGACRARAGGPDARGPVAAAISDIAGIEPPRSWPDNHKSRFKSLPYDLQRYVAAHEKQREKVLRRAQNEAALARQQLAAGGAQSGLLSTSVKQTQGNGADDLSEHQIDAHGNS